MDVWPQDVTSVAMSGAGPRNKEHGDNWRGMEHAHPSHTQLAFVARWLKQGPTPGSLHLLLPQGYFCPILPGSSLDYIFVQKSLFQRYFHWLCTHSICLHSELAGCARALLSPSQHLVLSLSMCWCCSFKHVHVCFPTWAHSCILRNKLHMA